MLEDSGVVDVTIETSRGFGYRLVKAELESAMPAEVSG